MKSVNDPKSVIFGRDLTKTFKDFWGRKKISALSNVDIDIEEGCIFGLLGPNGAGKSTLIKLILGHLYPTKGAITVLGKSPRDVPSKRKIGYVPENTYLYKNLTAIETLEYFGALLDLGKRQIKNRSQQLMDMVGLGNARNRLVGEFSHGMGRRLGLAQALLNDPSLLILDEPTAGLDPLGCREVKDLLITLGKRGKTIVLTSHLLADVEDVCHEVALLYGGRIQSRGKVSSLLKNRNFIQIQCPNVKDETLDDAINLLARDVPKSKIMTTSPSDSLESYFVKVVQGSTAKSEETSGALMGTGVADYLQDENYQDHKIVSQNTIDSSTNADRSHKEILKSLEEDKTPSSKKNQPAPNSTIDHQALQSLSSNSENNDTHQQPDSENVDKKVLDDLTQ